MKPNNLQEQLFNDRAVRIKVTSESHQWFFSTYFANYITHQTSEIHKQLFAITEDQETPLSVVVAFRGSAKSTIMTMSYPIWAIAGKQQKKFVLIASQTQYQARVHLTNIKRELESNELLTNDLGPFVEQREEWGSTSLYIPKYNARITAISTEQSVRGIRHGAFRPDLVIADDVEDMQSVKTREGRNKTYDWYTSEIIPIGDTNTKRIAIGNLLHEDSLLMRLREGIEAGTMLGKFARYPLLDRNNVCLWPGKYPNIEAITKLEKMIGNNVAWQREYLLNIVADEDQIIDREWIKYYEELPGKDNHIRSGIGIDLAISQKQTADYTAMIVAGLYSNDSSWFYFEGDDIDDDEEDEWRRIYIMPEIVNKRLNFRQMIDHTKVLYTKYKQPKVYVEDVAYQKAAVEQLAEEGLDVAGVQVTVDKRARLNLVSHLIQDGTILFPRHGAEELITQLVHFGVEKHDDLVDAFTLLMWRMHHSASAQPRIRLI